MTTHQYDMALLLLKLKNGGIKLKDFLTEENNLGKKIAGTITKATNLTLEQTKHECSHKEEWIALGINAEIYKAEGKNNDPFTAPDQQDLKNYIVTNQLTEEQFIEIYKQVIYAPMKHKLPLGYSDKLYYNILAGNIKNREELDTKRISEATTKN